MFERGNPFLLFVILDDYRLDIFKQPGFHKLQPGFQVIVVVAGGQVRSEKQLQGFTRRFHSALLHFLRGPMVDVRCSKPSRYDSLLSFAPV